MNWLVFALCLMKASSSMSDILQAGDDVTLRASLQEWLFGSIINEIWPIGDPPEDCPSCECGIATTRRRIVGGTETRVLEYPWMTLLMYNDRFYCGGSLLNDLYVLTAAHCTFGFSKELITVRFLEHNRSIQNETNTIERKVSDIKRHWLYNPLIIDNDIALLKLDRRVDLSSALRNPQNGSEEVDNDVALRPVCLPSPDLSYSNYSGVVSGWGTTSEGGQVSDVLQDVTVPILSNEECRQSGYGNRITDNMMCAGEEEGGRDACQGDSGGPLHVVDSDTERYQEVGIVSWGNGCARPNYPGVYARVNRYMSWIERHTRDACYCETIVA